MKTCKLTKKFENLRQTHKQELLQQKKKYEKKLSKQEKKHEKEIEIYRKQAKDLQDRIQDLATKAIQKSTTINNTKTTNILNLTPFDMSDKSIKDKIQEKYDLGYFMKGQRGVAEFTKENLLLDDKGELMYFCCDPARNIFKYKDKSGEVRKDVKANRLSKTITPNILTKAHSLVMEEVKNNDEESEEQKSKMNMEHYDMFFKIKELEANPEKLGSELSKLIT